MSELQLYPGTLRGGADHGWLQTRHSFSFAEFHDPARMGFGVLRVINEDVVAPLRGFATHGHRDMEIITIVLSGVVEHVDTLGNTTQIKPGEVQIMRAGTGIRHSEKNPSPMTPLHLLQIWILPRNPGVSPAYGQTDFSERLRQGDWVLAVSPGGQQGSLVIDQDAQVWVCVLEANKKMGFPSVKGLPLAWLQVATGEVKFAGQRLQAGDALYGPTEQFVGVLLAENAGAMVVFFALQDTGGLV